MQFNITGKLEDGRVLEATLVGKDAAEAVASALKGAAKAGSPIIEISATLAPEAGSLNIRVPRTRKTKADVAAEAAAAKVAGK